MKTDNLVAFLQDESELDEALYLIIELMEDAEQQFDKENYEKQQKIENDQKQAEEARVKTMETFRESRERSKGSESKLKKKRATGGETHCNIYIKNLSRNMS